MAVRRAGFIQMSLRDAVKTEQQMIIATFQMIFRARHWRVKIRRLDFNPYFWRDLSGHFFSRARLPICSSTLRNVGTTG
jgi:hypothetical protein